MDAECWIALYKVSRAGLTAIGIVSAAVAGCASLSRHLPITNHAVLLTAAFSPYLMLSGPASAFLLIAARRSILAFIAISVTVTTLPVEISHHLGSNSSRTSEAVVRVMSANLHEGLADPDYLVGVAQTEADVVAFQELTPHEVDRLTAAGLDMTFPYRWLDERAGGSGAGIWSRLPMDTTARISGYTMALISAQVRIPDTTRELTVLAAHIPGPWPQPIDDWRRDLDRFPQTLLEIANGTGDGAVVVAGDFNGTTDMRPFRALLRDGYGNADEQAGTWTGPTFPADWGIPPILAIDHILTRNCGVALLRTIAIPGSDHRGLVATVTIPRLPSKPA